MSKRRNSNETKVNGNSKEAALKKYNDTEGHFSLVRCVSDKRVLTTAPHNLPLFRNFALADLVTIMNGFCGSFSIFSSARYLITNDEAYLYAALAYPLAGLLFDFLDGKVARWRKASSMLGQELDSLADLVSHHRVSMCNK